MSETLNLTVTEVQTLSDAALEIYTAVEHGNMNRARDLVLKLKQGNSKEAQSGAFYVFQFSPPTWVNAGKAETAEEALQRAADVAQAFYPLGVQTGIHAMIEWCGVMVEYVKMLDYAAKKGADPRNIDKHHGIAAEVPDFMVTYLCEKLGCQLIPFMKNDVELWRQQFASWCTEAASTTDNHATKV
jgi:hypothetical protein